MDRDVSCGGWWVPVSDVMFTDESTEVVLLVNASNAFNSLNRQVALRNISIP